MSKKLIYWFIISGMIIAGCIDDTTQMGGKELSTITIESAKDSFRFELGEEVRIDPVVKQLFEGQELNYEWRYGKCDPNNDGKIDSLKFLPCTDVVLSDFTNFRKTGEYTVRLRAYNNDGSSFYYFKVFIRSTYDNGLMVLSKDENKKGRLSYLRVLNETELLLEKTEPFRTDAFNSINPGIELEDPVDMIFWKREKMILFAQKNKGLQFCDQSLVYLYPVTWKNTKLVPEEFYELNGTPYLLGSGSGLYVVNVDALYGMNMLESTVYRGFYTPSFESGYGIVSKVTTFVNDDRDRLFNTAGSTSEDLFKGKEIINLTSGSSLQPDYGMVVTQDKENSSGEVTISWVQLNGLFNPGVDDYTYTPSKMTLKKEMRLAIEGLHLGVAFYFDGPDLYRWALSGYKPSLPEEPIMTINGEITCLTLSNDLRYLYIGVYDPRSTKELKGSVWVVKIDEMKVVKKFDNIADRPVKILYKENVVN